MSIPPGVSGYEGLIEKALELKAKDLWACFCLSETAWDDDAAPTAVTPGDSSTDEPYLFMQATEKFLVRSISEEEYAVADPLKRIYVGGLYWLQVADADAYEEYARWVYLRWNINTNDGVPAGTFRQMKVFSGLTPATGYETAWWLAPENVQSNGRFRWGRNYPARTIISGETWNARIIIEER